MTKVCKRCNTEQPIENFGPHKQTKDRLSTLCRPCDSKRQVEYQKNNPEKYKSLWFKRGIERHGITQKQYDDMLKSHNGKCWLCDKKPSDGKRLSIDHNHSCCPDAYSCGKCIRGLLCMNCNTMIGNFEKAEIKVQKIHEYLRHW